MSKCDVCGKETSTTVCCSTCGAISFSYCAECLNAGIEPYDALVGMGLYYADINKTYRQQILDPSLRFHNKTREQFDADVEAEEEGYRIWLVERESEMSKDKESKNETDDF